jgi:hypothetical protein
MSEVIDFIITFFLGSVFGCFVGLTIAGLAVVSSRDSRERERMEEEDENN